MAGEPALAAVDVIPLRRNRTFQVILAGHIVSVLGDGFHSVALSIWVLQSTGSAKAMASVMALRIIIGILLGAVAGTVADRTDRRRLMWTMDLLRGVLVLGIAWLVATPGAPFWALLLLAAPIMAAGRRLRRRGWWVNGAVILVGPLLAVMGLVTGPRAALPVSLAMGLALSFPNVLVSVALQTEVLPEVQGRVFGTMNALNNVAGPVSIAAAGILADLYGAGPVVIFAGAGIALTGALCASFLRGLREYN